MPKTPVKQHIKAYQERMSSEKKPVVPKLDKEPAVQLSGQKRVYSKAVAEPTPSPVKRAKKMSDFFKAI